MQQTCLFPLLREQGNETRHANVSGKLFESNQQEHSFWNLETGKSALGREREGGIIFVQFKDFLISEVLLVFFSKFFLLFFFPYQFEYRASDAVSEISELNHHNWHPILSWMIIFWTNYFLKPNRRKRVIFFFFFFFSICNFVHSVLPQRKQMWF